MADPLRHFLARLALEPVHLAEWLSDPEAAMAAAGLDDADRALLRERRPGPLLARLSDGTSVDTAFAPRGEPAAPRPARGTLTVAGTGIRTGQLTVDAIAGIRSADRVHYLVAEPVARDAIASLHPSARSLADLYAPGKPRPDTYRDMVDRILESVRAGWRTCAVFYGHPGVFVDPAHVVVREARAAGFSARMLAGVSAEDCLFADLGVDPAGSGCQSYEATDFLVNNRRVDPTSPLVLWQVGVLGDRTFTLTVRSTSGLAMLVERLTATYPRDHRVCVYEAAVLPGCEPRLDWVTLDALGPAALSIISTIYVPPSEPPRVDFALYLALGGSGD